MSNRYTAHRLAAIGACLVLAAPGLGAAQSQGAAPPIASSPRGDGSTLTPMRRTTHADRFKAAKGAAERRKAFEAAHPELQKAKPKPGAPSAALAPAGGAGALGGAAGALLRLALAQAAPSPAPDLYAVPNYATSKYPTGHCSVSTATTCQKDADCPGYLPPVMVAANQYPGGEYCTGPVVAGTGIQKFVDTLPGLCALGTNDLGNCLPVATPDTATFSGSDYYELGITDFTTQFHRDLPRGTKIRGYYQKNTLGTDPASAPHYLGPFIVARTNRPVRVKLVNELGVGAAGNLFIPVDKTLPGAGLGPKGPASGEFTENRATIHLHGGNSPWISDGTQHQWTVPAGEATDYKKGLSVDYVPDMWFDAAGNLVTGCAAQTSCASSPAATNDPGDGALTFYWTNQQSGRLMFFHDHSYGVTRLNVYAGEAAGYLLVNPPDEDRLAAGTVPGTIGTRFFDPTNASPTATSADLAHLIPLVIQDKTFVPPAAQLAQQDPTWDPVKWGGEDQLWFPHVYLPNQWPGNPDNSNTNPMGRWDYGPWFWPPQTSLSTVTWDGLAQDHPLTGPCTSAAAQTAANPTGATTCPNIPLPSSVPETFLDTMVVNGTAYPTITVDPAAYRFQILNAANERNLSLSFFVADASGTEVKLVDAAPHTAASTPPLCTTSAALSAVTGLPFGPDVANPVCWPREWPIDARQGGVPDPASAGPKILQIGSEAGLLPAPATIPPRPVGFEQNKRNIVVLNVSTKALFVGPAERADVVVDFSAYAGKTLILYNDAPAPVPAGDVRQDLYTGDPDFTTTGGPPSTLPGYGPNTRTVMQVVVRPAPLAGLQQPLDEVALTAALRQSFVASQPAPIVPEAAYNALYNPATPFTNTYLPIQALSLDFTPVGAAQPTHVDFGNKALHELFTADYGRMDSLLGVEIPNTNWLNQTTIPFWNIDPATEYLPDGQTQIWKITHNGVDTHTIHFHLFNVQIINRVGWDGQIRPPDDNELGWKEAVRMNPLEDILVALKPVKQNLPWPLPDKWRPMDVDRPVGIADAAFTGVDVNNLPITLRNDVVNYGQEYVWHCHLLGHEEQDMLRAEILVAAPETPSGLTAASVPTGAQLTWSDDSKSALSFDLQRDVAADFSSPALVTKSVKQSGPQPGLVTLLDADAAAGQTYFYRVKANKSLTSPALPGKTFDASSGWSNVAQLGTPPAVAVAPSALTFGPQLLHTASAPQTVTLTTSGAGSTAVGVTLTGPDAADFAQTSTCGAAQTAPGSCTITVTFTPSALGSRSATLTVTTSDPTQRPTVALTGTGAAPIAGASPTALAFGNQVVNTASAPLSVTLGNTGALDLAVGVIAVAGPDAASFAASAAACPATLPAGQSCTVTVTFRPTVAGARLARLTLATSDPVNPTLTVSLSGNGTAPLLGASPASLAFPGQLVTAPPTPGAAQTVTLANTGTAAVQALALALGGADAAAFAFTTTCGAALPAGGACTASVTFAPASTAPKAATLTVSGTDGTNPLPPLAVALTGSGVAPVAALAPTSLTFATQVVATPSPAQTVVLSNAGTGPLVIRSIATSGDFAQTSGCGPSLAAGASCAISVTFTPTAAGPRTGALTVTSSDPANPTVSAALAGTGTAVDLSPTVLAFGSQRVGTTSASRNATLINAGATPLAITSVTVTGANAADYTMGNNCNATLGAGRSCTLSLRFAPGAVGPSSASLSVVTSDPASPSSIALSGTGTAPAAAVSPASLAFSGAMNVTSAPQSVTLANTGTAPLVINGIGLGGANPSQFARTSGCGASLAPGASCTIAVTFTPTAVQGVLTKTATLTVNVAAPATAQTVALSGTIVVPTFTLTPVALTFAKQAVATTSAAQSVVVANTGTVPLGIRGITLGGNNVTSFAQTSTCGTSLAAGASCTVDVTFTPTRAGTRTATLNVRVAAPAVSQSVNLTGTGQ